MSMKKKFELQKYMNELELEECGIEKPYSFLMKLKIDLHHRQWYHRKLREEKRYLDQMFEQIDPNIKLDKEQRKAILCEEKHQLMIAGAGSGKTTTLSARIKYLVEKKGVMQHNILVITYTNEAVAELKQRLQREFQMAVDVMTFHKFCYDIVRQYDQDYYVLEEDRELLLDILFDFKCKHPDLFLQARKYYHHRFIVPINHPKSFLSLCQKWIHQSLEYGQSPTEYDALIQEYHQDQGVITLLKTIQILYQSYLEKLKRNDFITFSQMITKAKSVLKTCDTFPYQYLFVDEYQDISLSRYQLLEQLANQFDVHILCVGDDFQSIFAFAGSEINLFFKIKEEWKELETFYITTTYRNSMDLVTTAGNFIMKNEKQLKKKLRSSKKESPSILLCPYEGEIEIPLMKILKKINQKGSSKNILLLGRYQFDRNILEKTELFAIEKEQLCCPRYPELKFTFLTVHQSKGLGFDEVILLNGSRGRYGFPSEIALDEADLILKGYTKEEQQEEERRLFYVALTRTKHQVYLLYPKYCKSQFITELMKEKTVMKL